MPVAVQASPRKPLLGADPADLRALVERYRVRWEVCPEYAVVKGHKPQVGFAVELSGTHERGVEPLTPGCPHCQEIFTALRALAAYLLPREERPSVCELGPFDSAIHYSPRHGNRPDVCLTIRILDGECFERPVDECESRRLEEIKERLRELGASEGRWSKHKQQEAMA